MFIDRVKIECIAGSGGNGIVAWRREKFIPKGGPSGGNGGRGGSLIIQADHNVYSLDWFTYKRILKAQNGNVGGTNCKQGRNGEDLIAKVPCGTLLKDLKTQEVLFDFTEDGQEFVLCKGGKGGKGNHVFRSSTNRAPNMSTPGQEGESRHIELELKLIADVGLIGLPNAGKSTLIKQLADVGVKIAPYPFTTLQPNLGYLYLENGDKVLLADIPGIIRGAHKNKGLGFEFLRHIERTQVLVYVIDLSGEDPIEDYRTLKSELEEYESKLIQKPSIIVLNKCDIDGTDERAKEFLKKFPKSKAQTYIISAEKGIGCDVLPQQLYSLLKK